MPYSDIEAKSIQSLCTIVDCEHKTAPYVDKSEFLVVRTSNVRNGQLIMDDMKYTTQAGYDEWTQRAVPIHGDVLFTREAPAGESCLVPRELKVCMGQRMVMLRPKTEKVDPVFLSLVLATEKCKSDISRLSIGSTVSRINISDIKKLRVPSPPLPEQKKIAQILSTWDKAITTNEQLLANSQQQKKALMQQLLTGKKRLLDRNGVRFSRKFTRYNFSDLLEIDRKSLGSKTDPNLEFDYISLSDVGTGTISGALERHTFKTSPSRARRIVSPGDILLATVRPNLQGFAKVREQYEHCIASTGFAVLTPKKGTCGDYVYHYLFGSHITGQINAFVVGTNYPAINSSDVSDLYIYCPHYEEQVEIAKALNSCDELIHALQRKVEALKQEKKALMQQLLTGKRRVKIDDKEVA